VSLSRLGPQAKADERWTQAAKLRTTKIKAGYDESKRSICYNIELCAADTAERPEKKS
jgi:AMMECR1 domain-containing protein